MTSEPFGELKSTPLTVVLISNGPGELTTWVKPIAEKLHDELAIQPRKSNCSKSLRLVLVPCPNATGNEKAVAEKWNLFEHIISAKSFLKLIINPKRFGNWPQKGVVVFLGGDQFWSVLLSARLRYKHITYAEWIARWPQWNDRIAAMSNKVLNKVPKRYRKRCKVVGDLMADIPELAKSKEPLPKGKWLALLPGSKKAKLCIGVPFMLEVADHLKKIIPDCNFLLPLAPTTNLSELKSYNSSKNKFAKQYQSKIRTIISTESDYLRFILETEMGAKIHILDHHPSLNYLSQCDIALTTVGANTAELGALALPMLVIVPTQHLNVMEAWDGFLGLIFRLPIIKWIFSKIFSIWRLKNYGFLAWPNISAGRMIVPEKIGNILPIDIAHDLADWLNSPDRLLGQKNDLKSLRGEPGALDNLTQEIIAIIKKITKEN